MGKATIKERSSRSSHRPEASKQPRPAAACHPQPMTAPPQSKASKQPQPRNDDPPRRQPHDETPPSFAFSPRPACRIKRGARRYETRGEPMSR